jgi:glycosyltransferase involved in cell wall biosynthesis
VQAGKQMRREIHVRSSETHRHAGQSRGTSIESQLPAVSRGRASSSSEQDSLRVLFIINSLGAGGAERSLAEMLPIFLKSGIDPMVVTLKGSTEGNEQEVTALGVPVVPVQSDSWWQTLTRLRRLIAAQKPDVVHTTIFEADVLGRLATIGRKTNVLTSLVNTSYSSARLADPNVRPWRLRGVQIVDGWTARRFNSHFHAITQAVKHAAIESLGIEPSQITVVERGRDQSRLGRPSRERRQLSRSRLGIPPESDVLVNVGRQEFQKGHQDLLRAMVGIAAARPHSLLLIAGREGNATTSLRRLCNQLHLQGHVRFLGHRQDVPDLLAASDVFVFPSIYEGLGGAVIEAMALGLPIVASNLPALREVLEESRNCLLVPPARPNMTAAAVERILSDPELRSTFAARSRAIFEERFTIDRAASRMAALLLRVGGREGPQDPSEFDRSDPKPIRASES